MVRFTLIVPKELNDWLIQQAKLDLRSKNKHIIHLLKELKEKQEKNGKRPNEG